MGIGIGDAVAFHGGPVHFVCRSRDGTIQWEEIVPKNLVVNAGLDKLLDLGLMGSTAITAWYCGLIGTGGTIASGDTMSSHAGWTELINFATAARGQFTWARVGRLVSNSAATLTYSINTAGSIMGAFVTSDSTKEGSAGVLLCGVAFTAGDKAVTDGDSLTITYSFSAAAT
jgi:hypothetical protein